MIKINLVPPEVIDNYWGKALELLSKAFEYSSMRVNPESVRDDCMSGDQSLWIVYEDTTDNIIGAFTIRIKSYDAGSTLCGEHLGGERLEEWADRLFEIMEDYAHDYQINKLELIGRRGWEKILKPKGWTSNVVIFEKEI